MPYRTEWVEPEVFLEHQGIVIYYAYKDEEADQVFWFHYAVPDDSNPNGKQFDIRDLDCRGFDLNNRKHHIGIIKSAIESKKGPFAAQTAGRSS